MKSRGTYPHSFLRKKKKLKFSDASDLVFHKSIRFYEFYEFYGFQINYCLMKRNISAAV